MLYSYADLYDWMYLMDGSKLLKDKLVEYEAQLLKEKLGSNAEDEHNGQNHTEEVKKILALKAIFEETFTKLQTKHKEGEHYNQIPNVVQREKVYAHF
jgi:hypothetical protein